MPPPQSVLVERIDAEHANPKKLWQEMGRPEYLSANDVEQLHAASRMIQESHPWTYDQSTIHLDIELPAHAVAALTIS
jgi:xylan 1,4-beta-xylosidase